MKKIKVLIVDDSVSVQQVLAQILGDDPEIEISAVAADPYEAVARIAEEIPDVITLDIEMPRMNGLTFLSKLMKQHPIPVIVISSVANEGSDLGIRALKLGASEIIPKPMLTAQHQLDEYRIRITDAVKASAIANKRRLSQTAANAAVTRTVKESKADFQDAISSRLPSKEIILIGASTGGPETISHILKKLKTDLPGILIVQHMPGEFTGAFAKRLNAECKLHVKEAEEGETVRDGCVYIANGYSHLKLTTELGAFKCRLDSGELINRHRPSVDVLFKSAAQLDAKKITAALLTGMGSDGAKGMLQLFESGATTFAQDEKSSVIFGMPKEAIKLNAAGKTGSPDELIQWLNSKFSVI